MNRTGAQAALAVGALGVVFGDIGTSPLYTIQTVFNPGDPHPIAATREGVFGVASLIFWSVTLIVTVTYVLLVMRADNDGEGGILALIGKEGVDGSSSSEGFRKGQQMAFLWPRRDTTSSRSTLNPSPSAVPNVRAPASSWLERTD